MATKKHALQVKVAVSAASCSVYATFAMVCPLCGVQVQAKTKHTCGDSSTRGAVDAIVKALGGEKKG